MSHALLHCTQGTRILNYSVIELLTFVAGQNAVQITGTGVFTKCFYLLLDCGSLPVPHDSLLD